MRQFAQAVAALAAAVLASLLVTAPASAGTPAHSDGLSYCCVD